MLKTIKRIDGSEVEIEVTRETFYGYAGYTSEGELIVAWADCTEVEEVD